MGFGKALGGFGIVIAASFMFVILSIIYYMLTIWIIKMGATWAGYGDVAGTTVVLTAGIVTAATIIGSALKR